VITFDVSNARFFTFTEKENRKIAQMRRVFFEELQ